MPELMYGSSMKSESTSWGGEQGEGEGGGGKGGGPGRLEKESLVQRPQQSPPCSPTRQTRPRLQNGLETSVPAHNPAPRHPRPLRWDQIDSTLFILINVKAFRGENRARMTCSPRQGDMRALTNGRWTCGRLQRSWTVWGSSCWQAGGGRRQWTAAWSACFCCSLVSAAACWPVLTAQQHLIGAKPAQVLQLWCDH